MASAVGVEAGMREVVRRVLDTDPDSCDLATASARLDDTRRIEAFIAARSTAYRAVRDRLLAEAAALPPEHRPDPSPSPSPDLDLGLPPLPPQSSREGGQHDLRVKWLARCPQFADALLRGEVTPALVDALARQLDRLEPAVVAHLLGDEARLLRLASRSTPDGFGHLLRQFVDEARGDLGERRLEQQRKRSKASTWRDEAGMYCLHLALDPERGPAVESAIKQRMSQLRRQPGGDRRSEGDLRLQAVIDLVCGRAHVTPEVLVVVDERTVRHGPHPHSMCETEAGIPLPPSIAVGLCAAGASVTAAIVDADGKAVGLGCASRTATRKQRRTLRSMYRTCAHPDCDRAFTDCEMHHVVHWEHGGETAVPNLVPLCRQHHHLVHDSGWNLDITPDRTLRWYRPDGTLEREVRLRPLLGRADAEPADDRRPGEIDADPPAPGRAPPRTDRRAA